MSTSQSHTVDIGKNGDNTCSLLQKRASKITCIIAMLCILVCTIAAVIFIIRLNSPPEEDKIPSGYNFTYPLTPGVFDKGVYTYQIGIVADLDEKSVHPTKEKTYRSYLKMGHLSYNPSLNNVNVSFDETETEYTSKYAYGNRGMESSELVTFDGKILTTDDKTGIVAHLKNRKIVPWVVLTDGNGNIGKGFKAEWATVKDEVLYVGAPGNAWVKPKDCEATGFDEMFVKTVTTKGEVHHVNWKDQYQAIQKAANYTHPGFIKHESVIWSSIDQKWYFLPRYCSHVCFDVTKKDQKGCNLLISADEKFQKIDVKKFKVLENVEYGFSSAKFIPGSNDKIIVALLSKEFNSQTGTYFTVFTVEGEMLIEPQNITTNYKYEGIEFF